MPILNRFRKRSKSHKIVVITILAILFLNNILYYLRAFSPDSIFSIYTEGYFSFITSLQRILFGFLPISLGDILYIIAVLYVVALIFLAIINLLRFRFTKLLIRITNLGVFLFLIWLLLGSQWNWNYAQPSLEEKMNLDNSDYSVDELANFTVQLINETKLSKEDANFDIFENGDDVILDISILGYKALAKKDDFFEYKYHSLKYSLFSDILPYIGITGYYNPFTAEAQITKGIPIVQIPFVINHELSHQLGIASEAEANFIGYLASINNPLTTVQYSGQLMLLRNCLSELKEREYENYESIASSIPNSIRLDFKEIRTYWETYRNKYRKYSDKGYDKFLKSNNQKEGLESYNKVVSLAIFYNRKK